MLKCWFGKKYLPGSSSNHQFLVLGIVSMIHHNKTFFVSETQQKIQNLTTNLQSEIDRQIALWRDLFRIKKSFPFSAALWVHHKTWAFFFSETKMSPKIQSVSIKKSLIYLICIDLKVARTCQDQKFVCLLISGISKLSTLITFSLPPWFSHRFASSRGFSWWACRSLNNCWVTQ